MEIQIMLNKIYEIASDVVGMQHKYGSDADCNIIALKVLDHIAGTDWVCKAQYTSLKSGLSNLKKVGYASVQEIIIQYCDEVQREHTIDGDLLFFDDPMNIGLVVSGRLLTATNEHTTFRLINKPKGKYYRVRSNT